MSRSISRDEHAEKTILYAGCFFGNIPSLRITPISCYVDREDMIYELPVPVFTSPIVSHQYLEDGYLNRKLDMSRSGETFPHYIFYSEDKDLVEKTLYETRDTLVAELERSLKLLSQEIQVDEMLEKFP